jgi:hypothetical protein
LTDGLAGSSTIDLKPKMLQGYISEKEKYNILKKKF